MTNPLHTLAASCFCFVTACPGMATIGLQIREGRPVVDGVYVNGQGPYRFLVDTGSTLNHLDRRVAEKIGLQETFHTTLLTSTGGTAASGGSGIEVTLDSVRASGQNFLFAGMEGIEQTWPDVKGVLGQEFLSHFDYLLDMRGRKLEFGQRECGAKATQTAYRMDHGRPVVATSLGWLLVDSGAPRITRFAIKATEANLEMRTATGTVKVGTIFSSLTIADRTFWRGEAIVVPHAAESAIDGMLPVSLFRSIYVSNSEGYIVFE